MTVASGTSTEPNAAGTRRNESCTASREAAAATAAETGSLHRSRRRPAIQLAVKRRLNAATPVPQTTSTQRCRPSDRDDTETIDSRSAAFSNSAAEKKSSRGSIEKADVPKSASIVDADQGWDCAVRDVCRANEIAYQGFSLLTANREVLAHPELRRIAVRHGRTASQIIFRFALDAGMLPLTGTTNAELEIFDFSLGSDEVRRIESLVER
jgi:hypothetical protein